MSEDLNYTPRLQKQYNEVIQKELLSNLKLSNIFEVPKKLSIKEAALAEPAAVALHAVILAEQSLKKPLSESKFK